MRDSARHISVSRFFAGAAMGALALWSAPGAAQSSQPTAPPAAQSTGSGPAEAEASSGPIVVTGSRIVRDGFTAPTPVTVVGQESLELRGQTNVGEALNELPSFRALISPATQQAQGGNVGARVLDLRSLGATRTLVLVDGKRFVPSTAQGTIDVNLIPALMVERSEVVTGGASAAYGSDAVAGVVNFILDKDFEGVKATAQYGISQEGDAEEFNIGVLYGRTFGDGRGHFVAAVEYNDAKGMGDCYTRIDWCPNEQLLSNTPAGADGLPANMRVGPNGTGNLSAGGLINTVDGPLRGLTFNSDGSARPYQYGQFFGTNRSPLFTLGGENSLANGFMLGITLSPPVERLTSYMHADYEISDDLKANVDFSIAQVRGQVRGSLARISDAVIQRDNAYLPDEIAAIMDANDIQSFTLGRFFADRGGAVNNSDNDTYRAVFSLEGRISDAWSWDAYYQYGRNEFRQSYSGNAVVARLRNALDAVTVGGETMCRINADADPSNNDAACQPLNIFGSGNVSDDAWAYVAPSGYQSSTLDQHVVAANVQGDLFNLPGGAFAVAVGAEYRRDSLKGAADALSTANQFWSFNGKAINGKIEVAEAYAEAVAPILRDMPGVYNLELNGAIRRTEYSRSSENTGSSDVGVTTWKLGGVYEPVEGVRIRATRSRDIRAPNLSELFGPVTSGRVSIIDPENAGLLVEAQALQGANSDLKPEKADTWTVGAVVTPVRNFNLSVDYFDISLDGAIATLGSQTIVERCSAGAEEFCPYVTRNSSGIVTQVRDVLNNVNRQKVRGIDIEASYRADLGSAGTLDLRALATNYLELSTEDSIGVTDRAGQTGYRGGATPGVPDWIVDGNIVWNVDRYQVGLHGHYIPKGKFDALLIGPEDEGYSITLPNSVNSNRVDGRFYLDLSLNVDITDRIELFGVINNLLDRDPPPAFSSQGGTNHVWFDTIGRYFKIGARVEL